MTQKMIRSKFELQEITLRPPQLKGDGARRTRPSARMMMCHQGEPDEKIAAFFSSQDALVSISIKPLKEASDLPTWKGVARVEKCDIKPAASVPRSEELGTDIAPVIRVPIVVEHENIDTIQDLVLLRLGMIQSGDVYEAQVTIRPFQGKLPFGEAPVEQTEADKAVDQWEQGLAPKPAKKKATRRKKKGPVEIVD